MIPTPFDYIAAKSLDEAVALLGKHGEAAKILAGGHSLVPAMKLRLAQPQVLIDISRIKDLAYIREEGNSLRVGAMTTHYALESSKRVRVVSPLLAECAAAIGDVQVRNRGTIGGSVVHADPAADWPAAMIALRVEMVCAGAKGERVIKADDFFVDLLTTAIAPGEVLREIRIPLSQGRTGQSYKKVRHPASGFAVVGVAVNLGLDAAGKCANASIGVTGAAAKAFRAGGAEAALTGKPPDAAVAAAAAAKAADRQDMNSDLYASAEYRRHLVEVTARRAVLAAVGAAK
ncbi:MAG: xanthine dehydrogenase family protein subunit M [Acidobacteriales bacterium]|nr:xanthine dehydrogenase family protein subunit M [Terriglobales bacterium]